MGNKELTKLAENVQELKNRLDNICENIEQKKDNAWLKRMKKKKVGSNT